MSGNSSARLTNTVKEERTSVAAGRRHRGSSALSPGHVESRTADADIINDNVPSLASSTNSGRSAGITVR